MAIGGTTGLQNPYQTPIPKKNPVEQAYGAYGGSVRQQAGDYDDIMNRYRALATDYGNTGNQLRSALSTGGYNPTIPGYQSTAEYGKAIGNLGGLAQTGGYSQSDIANIRERGISPIRSVYANAQQNVNRQRALQGGYSPNYNAVSAKMAREMASQLSDQTTNVNAQIAQNVAQNRLQASTPYASITAGEQGSRNDFALKAAEMANEAKNRGATNLTASYLDPLQGRGSALAGMTNLYGTTPAFANMMGGQASNLAQIQGNIQGQNQSNALRTIGQYNALGGQIPSYRG